MATLYCDLEAGNDSNDGTTFTNRFKTFDTGATAARTAPGDTIRIMASTDPTSIGTCAWTNKTSDGLIPGTVNVNTASDPTVSPVSITTSTVHGLSTGDIVQITGQTGQAYINGLWEVTVSSTTVFTLKGSLAAGGDITTTGTVRKLNTRALKLSTACNKTIDMCENNWTASANVVTTVSTNKKQGDGSANIAIAAGFTTGLSAFKTLPSAIDLSSYQQVTFWIKTNANIPVSNLSIRLCSDTLGVTTVDTIAIPAIPGLNVWVPITVSKGSALGASIQSVALYVDTDFGAVTVNLDNIAAVKSTASADSLGLQSLVGKNTALETFYPLASIEETILAFDCGNQFGATAGYGSSNFHIGYYGTTESVTTYKLEPIQLAQVASGSNGLTTQEAGTAGNMITYSGGWDRTAMTSQTGITWIDGRNALGNGIILNFGYQALDHVGIVRAAQGVSFSGTANQPVYTLDTIHANGNGNSTSSGILVNAPGYASLTVNNIVGTNLYACNNSGNGIFLNLLYSSFNNLSIIKANCNGFTVSVGYGLNMQSYGNTISIGESCGNRAAGVLFATSDNTIITNIDKLNANLHGIHLTGGKNVIDTITQCNDNDDAFYIGPTTSEAIIKSVSCSGNTNTINLSPGNSSTIYSSSTAKLLIHTLASAADTNPIAALISVGGSFASVSRWGDVSNAQRIYYHGGNVIADTTIRHTLSGNSWRMAPTSTLIIAAAPLRLPIAKFAVNGSALVTVSGWFRRSNTALTLSLFCAKKQLAGFTSDISTSMSASGDQTPTSITSSGTTATVTKVSHGYSSGQTIQITGANETAYNGVFIITVTDADHFTYTTLTVPSGSPATGTLVMGRWEQLTITFTPTEPGVVEIEAQAYGGSTNFGYVDDLTISQI